MKDLAKEIRLVEVDTNMLSYLFSVGFFNSSAKMYILWQDIFQQNIGRTGPQFPGSPLSKVPLTASQNSGRPPGKKKGPKPKEVVGTLAPTGTKKQSQKSLLKAEAGELDLIEIHTKHTLKKCNPGKSKSRNKV